MDSERLKEIEQHKKLHNPEFQDAEELAAAAKDRKCGPPVFSSQIFAEIFKTL